MRGGAERDNITAQRGNYENCLLPKIGITLVKDGPVDDPIDIITRAADWKIWRWKDTRSSNCKVNWD